MTQSDTIRRHSDGAIDFDFYRADATALRGQALRDTRTLKTACTGLLTMVGAIAVIVLITAAPPPASNGHGAMAQVSASQVR